MTQAYPLQWPVGWPRTSSRRRAKFSKGERQYSSQPGGNSWINRKELSIDQGTKRVVAELERLGVPYGESIISTNLELRLDGLPRSNQSAPADPGVAVYWRKPGQQMKVMAIDIYDRVADNLAAIAATLDAMRAIERHGGAQILERAFTGFTALAAHANWRSVLGFGGGDVQPADVKAKYRELASACHPDNAATGDAERFKEITRARDEALRDLGGA